ncbi:MAG: tRNA (5-methylaminomethyl-2-thiouridylate)-methyltransferase / FAD-dependent cmnm(5)s(2)U34 oxidoreductase [uncultured Ramlibacter sp.]|uniref:tRNA 5-methylaminomethyl-2-thiouridine biosynthesis bifunctional protein MnmC n=1 Tax=uncultured Ramlibacter sp. TaxID=260755 RepID=A0A6J4NR49_9BURK|nr:MAG: tRNA (5-methylaminomethyl-2-thiouridylate)-methyltransferase / FAD-dependent cmnm(5)s(2)U34 oxidoreductase [uncultured Ramlibacter sp.]
MAEPVDWSAEGTPRSARFDDIYRSSTGAPAQARHVFLGGCNLPNEWAGQPQWRILETGFGLGLNFLAAWRAWKNDPQRPRLLHFVSMEAWPVSAQDIERSAAPWPELAGLARQLAAQWWGLVPGFHRLAFDEGRVLLTLCIGDAAAMLQEQAFAADSVFLDGFDPQRNPAMWDLKTLKAVARCCGRGTAVATWTVSGQVRRDLGQCGFQLEKVPGLPPKRESLRGRFDPAWQLRRPPPTAMQASGNAIVIGAGLAGAAVAASLARRGWQVQVLDAAEQPAAGASALPAGLLAPHTSPDDNLLSRLSRAGVRITLQQCRELLEDGEDWQQSGVLERRGAEAPAFPDLGPGGEDWQRQHDEAVPAVWHAAAGWIKPAALVQAWLSQDGVQWKGRCNVTRLEQRQRRWHALAEDHKTIADGDLVVVAAAAGSAALLQGRLRLQPVRGQVSLGTGGSTPAWPAWPLNGNGHFLPSVPLAQGRAWLSGSTYVRGDTDLVHRHEEQLANLARLQALAPEVAEPLAAAFNAGQVAAWTGVRCASSDRRPLVGEIEPGLWANTAMGSRGLTFAALCAELLAARLHGEPLPLPAKLAAALDPARQRSAPVRTV